MGLESSPKFVLKGCVMCVRMTILEFERVACNIVTQSLCIDERSFLRTRCRAGSLHSDVRLQIPLGTWESSIKVPHVNSLLRKIIYIRAFGYTVEMCAC